MKKLHIALLSLLAIATSSCDDFLDVRPKGEQVENDQFSTPKGFEDAIYGIYGYMTEDALYGKDMVWGVAEILSQDLRCDDTFGTDLGKYDYKSNSSTRSRFLDMWTKSYEAIGYTNNALKNLEQKSPESLPLHDFYKAELLGLRAMLHFDLLRYFAPTDPAKRGIPYVKTFNFSVKPFSTVGECFEFIIADLTEAESLLKDKEVLVYPRDNDRYDRFLNWRETHMNLHAVRALLARVYWYMGNKAKAAEYAEAVIRSGHFPLVDVTEVQAYVAGVLSPKETIFGLYSTKYLSTATSYLYTYQSNKTYNPFDNISGKNYMQPWTAVYSMDVDATAQDYRKNQFRQSNGVAFCLKLVDYQTIENNNVQARPELIAGISLIHSAEMYLIAADALLESNYPKAVEYFNTEISSRGLSTLPETETLTAERIYNEFHKELFCEGQQWFNMKRLNRDIISNVESRTIPANDDLYVLPIPEEEFEYRPETTK